MATVWASALFWLDPVVGRHLALEELLDDVRVVLQELGGHQHVGGHVLAVRPQVALVDEDLAAALLTSRVAHGSGHPGALDVTGDEGLQRLAVVLRGDADVAATGLVGAQPVLLEPRPQGHVLRVAEAGRGQLLP